MRIKSWIVHSYLFLMLGIFPLYYQNKYFNIGNAKYQFFKYATCGMLALMAIIFVVEMVSGLLHSKDRKKRNVRSLFSVQDAAVLLYMFSSLCSWILSPYRSASWIGSHEWYMGLLSQLLFVGIYFCVSRYEDKCHWLLGIIGVSAATVFLIAYLHRFRIDPLGMYEEVAEGYWIAFLGTIGNANWYSSYLCVVLPAIIGIYIFGEQRQDFRAKIRNLLLSILLFLGFATTVTQNSDSAYAGMLVVLLFCLWFSLEEFVFFKRFLEVVLIGILACKFTGYLQLTYPEKAIQVSEISTMLSQGRFMWILLVIVCVIHLIVSVYEKKSSNWIKIQKIRKYMFMFLFIAFIVLMAEMWLVTTQKINIESGFLAQTGYLNFTDNWGSNRGIIWKYAIKIFEEYSLKMKLFGCGPDALMHYTREFHQAEIQAFWGDTILTNVHNEWLNMLINYGIIGAAAYLSIFITCTVRVIKAWKENTILLAFAAAVLGYMGHNFFCFQQVVCTPLIFIVIGMAEYVIKQNKKGVA